LSFPANVIPVFGSQRPYVDLNFALGSFGVNGGSVSSLALLSGFTFTRASLAMGYDATGKLTYGPNNLLLQSQTFDNGSWNKISGGTGSAPVVTANQAIAPDGTMTADLAVFTLNGGTASGDNSSLTQSVTSPAPNITSLWAMTSDGSTKVFSLLGVGGTLQTITITGTWQRFFVLETGVAAAAVRLRLRGSASGEGTATSASIYLWGAQLEAVTYQTTPSTYYPTTTAAYYGPRLVYDPVTLASLGILVEEARTNLALQSQTFDNASWTKTAASITANAVTSPDGTANADKLVEDTANSQHRTSQGMTTVNGTTYTFSVIAKAGERQGLYIRLLGAGTIAQGSFNLQAGTVNTIATGTGGMRSLGNGWYLCYLTGAADGVTSTAYLNLQDTASGTSLASYTGDGTSGLYLYQAQLELGQGASSPIPTTTAAVTRAADVANLPFNMPVTSTWAVDFQCAFLTAGRTQLAGITDSGTSRFMIRGPDNGIAPIAAIGNGSSVTSITGSTVVAANVATKLAVRVDSTSTNAAIVMNGGAAVTGSAQLASATTGAQTMRIGCNEGGAAQLNGTISRIRIYNSALTDAQLQSLTS
jgi:hypothetical protein